MEWRETADPFTARRCDRSAKRFAQDDKRGRVVVEREIRGTRMAHRRSLDFARDDKKERVVERERTVAKG